MVSLPAYRSIASCVLLPYTPPLLWGDGWTFYSLSGIRGPPAQATWACSFYKIFRISIRRWRLSGFTTEALRVLYGSEP
jgi:hypothetical protein